MQKSEGGEPNFQNPKQHPGAEVPAWEFVPLSHSLGEPGESWREQSSLLLPAAHRGGRTAPELADRNPGHCCCALTFFPSNKAGLSADFHFVVLATVF